MTAVDRLGTTFLFGALLAGAVTLAAAPTATTPPAAAPATVPAPSATTTADERVELYHQFRGLFDSAKFADALPLAQKLVDETRAAGGENDPGLVAPLVNLATTEYQLDNYPAAEESYLKAIKIVEEANGGFSKNLLPPLQGLGLTYLAAEQPQAAMEQLRRAVDIVRKVDGLFSENQLPYLDPLVRSYQQLGSMADAEREAIYSYRVSENKAGRNSTEVAPALERLAAWYSDIGRNTTARQYYTRAIAIIQKNEGPQSQLMIPPLRGIAETYRLEYIFGPELSPSEQNASTGPGTATLGGSLGTPQAAPEYNPQNAKPDPNGESALRGALDIAESAKPNIDTNLHVSLLLELGDWLMLDNEKEEAMRIYKRAWPLLANLPAGHKEALLAPSQIMYRPPSQAYRSQRAKPENIVEGYVDAEFTVEKDGKVTGEHVAGKSANDTQERAVLNAVRKARYRPRFENGEPVATPGVRLHQVVYTVKSGKS